VFMKVAKLRRIESYFSRLDTWLQNQSEVIPSTWAFNSHNIQRDVRARYLPPQLLGALLGHPDPKVAMSVAEHHQLPSELLEQVHQSDMPPDVVSRIMALQALRFGDVQSD